MTTTQNTAKIEAQLATLPADLSTAKPQQIDTVLAELYALEAQELGYIEGAKDGIHRALGQRQSWMGRRQVWLMPFSEALALAEAKVASTDYVDAPRGAIGDVKGALAYLVKHTDALAEINAAQAPLHAEYADRPWSRFFWVQNNGGHVHSSMNCSTCNNGRTPTRFGWNPDLSGLTEAAAVAKLGPSLCTVCFPSAPVEYTQGADKGHCSGSGQPAVEGTRKGNTRSSYGECTGCHEMKPLTSYYVIRAHKAAK